jgi:Uncharacterized conserved protein
MIDGMNEQIVRALYETLPVDVIVFDENDEIITWNKHETRLFKRPLTAMGIDYRTYHPSGSCSETEKVIGEMKLGNRDKARFWFDVPVGTTQNEHKILVDFIALRDDSGKYLGCMECIQDIEEIRNLKGELKISEDPRYEFIEACS